VSRTWQRVTFTTCSRRLLDVRDAAGAHIKCVTMFVTTTAAGYYCAGCKGLGGLLT
jgi:hypothetical protein